MNVPDDKRSYSPFWGLIVVFGISLFIQSVSLSTNLEQRALLKTSDEQLAAAITSATSVSKTLEALSRELLALAPGSEEARKIIAEHNIRLNVPAANSN